MADLHDLTALEQAAAIRAGDVSAVELTEHYISRTQRLSEQVGAFVTQAPELALDQAKAADERVRAADVDDRLPTLLGVVCPVKDLDFVAGVPTRFGSTVYDITPEADANVVVRMRSGGLVFTGKTNTPELGLPCYTESDVAPPARSPWDLTKSAGGSSGGASAAVAAGLAPVAHGSDGGGSIRIPAAVTGLVGIKPSRGRVSNGPLGDFVGDLGVKGPLARTVADAAALLDVMSGSFPDDPLSAPAPRHGSFVDAAARSPHTCRIGFYTTPSLSEVSVHPAVIDAVTATVHALEALGHELVEIDPPFDTSLLPLFMTLWSSMALLAPIDPELEPQLRPLTRYLRDRGREVSGHELAAAVSLLRINSRAALTSTSEFDAVLAPTLADVPAAVGQQRNDADPARDFADQVDYSPYCAAYNVTGQPAINVPMNWTPDGLPVGVQLVGRMYDEETIISLAAQLEMSHSWLDRRPVMW